MKYIDSCPVCGGTVFIAHIVDEPEYHDMGLVRIMDYRYNGEVPILQMTIDSIKMTREEHECIGDECILCNTTFC